MCLKKYLLSVIFAFMVCCGLRAQTGTWSGSLQVQGVKIPLVFHLEKDKPTLDSPAQGAKGIPIKILLADSDSLRISIPSIRASFEGKVQNNEIVGTFTQSGATFPLLLNRGEQIAHRPQTPRPPFPYEQEDVSFANGDAVLKGTLVYPKDYTEDTPVVIMITGSGLQNRDEEIHEHKPFAVIADALARNGIASLRYDDRGFGESTGDPENCTTEDLKNDALAGIKLLRERFHNVGVLGHSEGGTIALMLGADNMVDFSISLAGMIVSGKELLLDQNRYLLSQASYSGEVIDEYCNLLEMAFDGDEAIVSKLESSKLPIELKQNLQLGLRQLSNAYMQYFLSLDIRKRLQDIACPVLALNGSKDSQVSSEINLEALKQGLPSDTRNKIEKLDGLNHMFQHCTTGSTIEYATIQETISPEVLDIICEWISGIE